MKNYKFTASLLILIIVDLIPLLGAFFLKWEINTVFIYYWIENAVFVFWLLVKAIVQKNYYFSGYLVLASFAWLFISFFWYFDFATNGYMSWIVDKSSTGFTVQGSTDFSKVGDWFRSNQLQVLISVIGYFISHGLSFFQNYIRKEEYKITSLFRTVAISYGRMIGGFVLSFLCIYLYVQFSFTMFGIVFIIAKTIIDVVGHLSEHAFLAIKRNSLAAFSAEDAGDRSL